MNSALRNKNDRRKNIIWMSAFVIGCFVMVAASCVHANDTGGYDVMSIDLPDQGYTELVSGCNVFPDNQNGWMDAWCAGDDGRTNLEHSAYPSGAIRFGGVIDDSGFTWYPSDGNCYILNKTVYSDYTAWEIICSMSFNTPNEIFTGNFE